MRIKYILCLFLICGGFLTAQDEINFSFKDQFYNIRTEILNEHSTRLFLKSIDYSIEITDGILGINHHPAVKVFKNYFVITFHSYYEDQPYLYMFNSITQKSSLLFYQSDFKFISTPSFIPIGNSLKGMVFLGNN